MTILNLSADPLLPELLATIIHGSEYVSQHDRELTRTIQKLQSVLSNKTTVDYNQLHQLMTNLAEIIHSYEISPEKASLDSSIRDLKQNIYMFSNLLEDYRIKLEVDRKHKMASDLNKRIDYFCKMAGK